MDFFKYQGTGNDFILIDDRNETFPVSQERVAHLCHRRFGIGADGLILLRNHPEYDFQMIYFNADGAEGSMCGNGGRCIVRFAHDLGLFETETRFLAVDGEHAAVVNGSEVSLKMNEIAGIDQHPDYAFLNTGSPHFVKIVEDVESMDVVAEGRPIRYDDRFAPGGTNANFIEPIGDNALFVRTYERGVEDETYSCGTGVTASALVAHQQLGMTSPVSIQTIGGNLRVSFEVSLDGGFTDLYLIGPAVRVYEGSVTI
ncbi:diaminopimelate epimerase [Larkinella terrae]|uniref:Diaminopimelate epimerase n=1 Tax=Larkinella terrae TaxID=2025311 RepID=A0A7K0EJQ4_9BACT|nr:diaminopimelate epimerase [Larkinella terrae]MRS62047.1 diaminopimelate epimerase [Larkinella terrae]